jgi:phosphoglycerate dehydrogenase-like enzyme
VQKGADCDVLLTWGMYRPALFVSAATHLKWIHALSAGFDGVISIPEIRDKQIRLTSTRGIHGLPIAEHTLCMMLMLTRGFHKLRDWQHQGEWRKYLPADEIAGKTVAILGVGEIGRVIAQKCKLMGMRVLGVGRRPVVEKSLDGFYLTKDLLAVLSQSDYVVISVPLTPETWGWIGERELHSMKKSAFLFNVARGPIVDGQALVKALKEGWIAGAGLDTPNPDPLPKGHELWSLPNVIISPHMAGSSPYYMHRAVKVFCENLDRFNQEKPLLFEFNWDKGY